MFWHRLLMVSMYEFPNLITGAKSSLRDFFTVLALSLHAVFEGLAVGLEDETKDVWMLFAGM